MWMSSLVTLTNERVYEEKETEHEKRAMPGAKGAADRTFGKDT